MVAPTSAAKLGVGLGLPTRHRLGILLVGPVQGTLWRQAELAQQPTHADLRQPYAELAADQLADHRAGPQRERELQLAGVVADDQCVDPLQLGAGQRGRPAGDRAGLERRKASLAVFRQPAIDRRPRHPQPRGNVFGIGTLLDLADRADPQLFQGLVVELAAVVVAHARTRPDHDHKVNLLMNGLVSALLAFSLVFCYQAIDRVPQGGLRLWTGPGDQPPSR